MSVTYVNDSAEETTPQRVASYSVITLTVIITIAAARYILRELKRVKPDVIYARRKARFVPPRCPFCTSELTNGAPSIQASEARAWLILLPQQRVDPIHVQPESL
jgi:hypothetical protein